MSNVNPGKAFSRIFTLPSPPKTPSTPALDTHAVQTASVEAAQRRNRARGFRSTVLSQLFARTGVESATSSGGGQPLRTTIGS